MVVEFLEGDPDRPLVVGSVYNPAQMPPYTLPAGADTMGFKSNTTKGGNGYNEIVAVDGKAGELIRIHAQKDMGAMKNIWMKAKRFWKSGDSGFRLDRHRH